MSEILLDNKLGRIRQETNINKIFPYFSLNLSDLGLILQNELAGKGVLSFVIVV
jgi:hypothetical protein